MVRKGPCLPLRPEVYFVPLGLTTALIKAGSQSTQEVAGTLRWGSYAFRPETPAD